MTTLFDTSTLIALLKPSDAHHKWSVDQLDACKAEGPVLMVDIAYSELSVALTKAQVDAAITSLAFDRLASNDEALFRAGKAFLAYRRGQGEGKKTSVLPRLPDRGRRRSRGDRPCHGQPKTLRAVLPWTEGHQAAKAEVGVGLTRVLGSPCVPRATSLDDRRLKSLDPLARRRFRVSNRCLCIPGPTAEAACLPE